MAITVKILFCEKQATIFHISLMKELLKGCKIMKIGFDYLSETSYFSSSFSF